MAHDFDLARFVDAQEGGTYEQALGEVRAGRKSSHWMWFIFPQVAGLGRSAMAERYAVSGLAEARAYLSHPELGRRLREVATAVAEAGAASAEDLLGTVDAMKLRSSMTLFREAAPHDAVFQQVLDRFFDGEADQATLRILGGEDAAGD